MSGRFWAKVRKTEGCWEWTGARSHGLYGSAWVDGKSWTAHRYAYTVLVGPIPDGLTLDHLCRNVICVNPDHLEPVTLEENIRRGKELVVTCIKGHPFVTGSDGRRRCRTCNRISARAYRARLSA